MNMKQMKSVILSNGVEMPQLGFGVYQVSPEDSEMDSIAGLDQGKSMFFSHYDPEIVTWLAGLGK